MLGFLAAWVVVASPSFDPEPGRDTRWSWPEPSTFSSIYESVRGTESLPVIAAGIAFGRPVPDGRADFVFEEEWLEEALWSLEANLLLEPVLEPSTGEITFRTIAGSRQGYYDSAVDLRGRRWRLRTGSLERGDVAILVSGSQVMQARVDTHARTMPVRGSYAADFAYAQGLLTLAAEDHAVARTVDFPRVEGACSQMRVVDHHALLLAEACFAAGRTECYLAAQVELIDFAPLQWREAQGGPVRSQLGAMGVDELRFFRGALLRFRGEWTDIRVRDVARAMRASKRAPELEAMLRELAQDPLLDDHNRLRAAAALSSMRWSPAVPDDEEIDPTLYVRQSERVGAELSALALPPIAAGWVRSIPRREP